MTIKNALLRPIEIHAGNNKITCDGTDYTIASGVYKNIFGVVAAIEHVAGITCYMSTAFRVVIGTSSAAALTATPLSDQLGYTCAEAGTSKTATYCAAGCWIADRFSSDNNQWASKADDLFYGSAGSDGNLCGITMTSRETRTASWKWIAAANAYPAAATGSYDYGGGDIRFPQAKSCFYAVANDSRTVVLVGTGSVSPKGVYFVPDVSIYLGSSPAASLDTAWDSGGTSFLTTDTTQRDNYVFCSIADPPKAPPASSKDLLSYYDVDVTLTTAVAPTWTGAY